MISYLFQEMIDIVMPTPMVSVMKCGIDSPGKLNMLKGIYLAAKPQSGLLEVHILSALFIRYSDHFFSPFSSSSSTSSSYPSSYPSSSSARRSLALLSSLCLLLNKGFSVVSF